MCLVQLRTVVAQRPVRNRSNRQGISCIRLLLEVFKFRLWSLTWHDICYAIQLYPLRNIPSILGLLANQRPNNRETVCTTSEHHLILRSCCLYLFSWMNFKLDRRRNSSVDNASSYYNAVSYRHKAVPREAGLNNAFSPVCNFEWKFCKVGENRSRKFLCLLITFQEYFISPRSFS